MIQFTIKDWHIWAKKGQDIAPPSLPEEVRDWLEDTGIVHYGIEWMRLKDPKASSYKSPEDILETAILFYRDKDAMVFKLRWYEYIAGA